MASIHPPSPPSGRRPLALVTGASSGIGFHLAACCARNGFDLLIASNDMAIEDARRKLMRLGANVDAVQTDLSTIEGVDRLYAALYGREVDALLANAGRGLGRDFLDQSVAAWRSVVDTNVTGTLYLLQKIGVDMRARGHGRILITGSIAGFMPGAYQAVYNGTKAFLDSFSYALRNELRGSGVTVTCLMPGPTDTRFFERADMLDTRMGTQDKDDPADVAEVGFEAMMKGEGDVISGWRNRLMAAASHLMPADMLAEQHRRMAAPGTARN